MINDFLCSTDQQFKIQTNSVIRSIASNQVLEVEKAEENSHFKLKEYQEGNVNQLYALSTTKICLKDTDLCLDTLNHGADKKTIAVLSKKQENLSQEWDMIPIARKKSTNICKEMFNYNKTLLGTQDQQYTKRDWPTISKRLLKNDHQVISEYTDIVSKLGEDIDLSANYRKYNKLSYTSDVADEYVTRNNLGSFYYYFQVWDRNQTKETNSPWHQFAKYYYYLTPNMQTLLSKMYCHHWFPFTTEKQQLNYQLCLNEFGKNTMAIFTKISFSVVYNLLMILISIRLTFSAQMDYYNYINYDWTKIKHSQVFKYNFKNTFALFRMEKILRRFEIFAKGIVFSNFEINNQYNVLSSTVRDKRLREGDVKCDTYFNLDKDKRIVSGAFVYYNADDILSVFENILFLHDVGERIRYYDLFYLDRLETMVNRSYFYNTTHFLDDHELQCFIAHLHNYFLNDDYEEYKQEYSNLEYFLQKFSLTYKSKMTQLNNLNENAIYESILTIMFSLKDPTIYSNNINLLMIDISSFIMQFLYRIFSDNEHLISFYYNIIYNLKALKFAYIRIVCIGSLYFTLTTFLKSLHPLNIFPKFLIYVMIVFDFCIFTMRKDKYSVATYFVVIMTYAILMGIIVIIPGLYYFTYPILLGIIFLILSMTNYFIESKKSYLFLDRTYGQRYSNDFSVVWKEEIKNRF